MFCSAKDKIPTHQKSNVVKCPGCGEDYFGKIDTCITTRVNEHSNHSDGPMFQHLQYCEKFLERITLYQLPNIDTDVSHVILQAYIPCAISDNWSILDSNKN